MGDTIVCNTRGSTLQVNSSFHCKVKCQNSKLECQHLILVHYVCTQFVWHCFYIHTTGAKLLQKTVPWEDGRGASATYSQWCWLSHSQSVQVHCLMFAPSCFFCDNVWIYLKLYIICFLCQVNSKQIKAIFQSINIFPGEYTFLLITASGRKCTSLKR